MAKKEKINPLSIPACDVTLDGQKIDFSTICAEHGGRYGFVDPKGRLVSIPDYEFASEFENGLALVKINGLYGVIDAGFKTIIEPVYESVDIHSHPFVKIRENGRYGLAMADGRIVVEPQYEEMYIFADTAIAVCKEGKWAIMNNDGQLVTDFVFDRILGSLNEGLASAKANGKVGFINERGEWVIKPEFDTIPGSAYPSFSDGLAKVGSDGGVGVINRKGEWVVKPAFKKCYINSVQDDGTIIVDCDDLKAVILPDGTVAPAFYNEADKFSDGLMAVCDKNGKWGYINLSGEEVVKPQFDSVSAFSHNLANVSIKKDVFAIGKDGQRRYDKMLNFNLSEAVGFVNDGLKGLCDADGNEIVAPRYDDLRNLGRGVMAVSKDGKWGLMDTGGKMIHDMTFDSVEKFYDDYKFAMFKRGEKYGLFDEHGNEVAVCDYLTTTADGEYRVKINGLYGLLDCDGKEKIPAKFARLDTFKDGLAAASDPETKLDGVIDLTGEWVIEPKFNRIDLPFDNDMAAAQSTDSKWGYIDRSGNWVIEPKYSNADRFRGSLAKVTTEDWKYLLVNRSGQEITKPASSADVKCLMPDGGTVFYTGRKFGIADKDGKIILKPVFSNVELDYNGYKATVKAVDESGNKVDRNAIIDYSGNYGTFVEDFIFPFSDEGVAFFKSGENYCFLNSTGQVLLPAVFQSVDTIRGGKPFYRVRLAPAASKE